MINNYISLNSSESLAFSLLEGATLSSKQKPPNALITHLLCNAHSPLSPLNQTFTRINNTLNDLGDASPYIKSALCIGAIFLGIELVQAGIKGIKHLKAHKEAIPLYASKGMRLAISLIVKDFPLVQEHFSQGHPPQ